MIYFGLLAQPDFPMTKKNTPSPIPYVVKKRLDPFFGFKAPTGFAFAPVDCTSEKCTKECLEKTILNALKTGIALEGGKRWTEFDTTPTGRRRDPIVEQLRSLKIRGNWSTTMAKKVLTRAGGNTIGVVTTILSFENCHLRCTDRGRLPGPLDKILNFDIFGLF
jgi:hypothetical protein